MKTLRLSFLLILLFPSSSFSQWISQAAATTSHLYDVQFVGKQTGWIVGNNLAYAVGTPRPTYSTVFLRTTDAGVTWLKQTLPNLGVLKLHFQSPVLGWAVGKTDGGRNLIMKTSDGGSSWFVQDSSYAGTISSVKFVDNTNGWAVGGQSPDTSGLIYKTTNGGTSWSVVNTSAIVRAYDTYFVDAQRGFVVDVRGVITRTTDGGGTWKEVFRTGQGSPLRRVFFATRDYGWAVGGIAGTESKVRTTDGGDTWELSIVTGSSLHGLWFVDSKNGWTVGGANAGLVIERTTDGGVSWEKQPHSMGNLGYFEAVCMTDVNEGWVVGEYGMILKTTSDGVTSVADGRASVPDKFVLGQNYPNPFNPSTAISYQLSAISFVALKVSDVLGREVTTLVDGVVGPGTHTVIWQGKNTRGEQQPSGVYFYSLKTSDFTATKRMILMK